MELDLGGKTAVVTGSSRGLGREVAVALSARGADVVLFARDGQSLEETAKLVKQEGRDPLVVAGDVSSPEDVNSLKLASKERFGTVSILVNAPAPSDQYRSSSNRMPLIGSTPCSPTPLALI
jgi:3-oxoacyl-[acyl-carrier protein] reductase